MHVIFGSVFVDTLMEYTHSFLLFDFLPSHLSFFYTCHLLLGPGCSSFNCGVMMEHSPVTQPLKPAGYCCIKGNPGLEQNVHTWTRATTMLYIEHPWGTGFSYGKPEPKTEYEASGDLYAFVQNFFIVFPHLHEHKLYVFGESYAGMFIPSIVRYFHHANLRKNNPFINIAGGAMVRENHLYIIDNALSTSPFTRNDVYCLTFSYNSIYILTLTHTHNITIYNLYYMFTNKTGEWVDRSGNSRTGNY